MECIESWKDFNFQLRTKCPRFPYFQKLDKIQKWGHCANSTIYSLTSKDSVVHMSNFQM